MAAPTFVGAGTGVVIASGSAAVLPDGVTVNTGDVLILQAYQDGVTGNATIVAAADVADLTGATSAMTVIVTGATLGGAGTGKQFLWIGRKASTGTGSVTVTSPGDDLYCRTYVFRNVIATATTRTTIIENGVAANGFFDLNGVTAVISDRGVTTNGADRLAIQFVAVDDDNPLGPFTGMTGGTWAEAVAEFASATGTDGAIQLQTATMASAGTIDGGSFTMAAADNWSVVAFALIPPVGGPATLERAAALNLVGLIATVGRETLPRTAALNATAAVTAAGIKITPGVSYERSAAVAATGSIASVGRELLPRAAVVAASGQVQVTGVRIQVITRTAVVSATGTIATVGRELLARSAVISATGGIATVGRELLARSAALNAAGSVAAAGREQLARLVELGALARVTASGVVEGPAAVTHSRSAAVTAAATIASAGRETLARAAAVSAAGSIVAAGVKRLQRTAAIGATGAVTARGEVEGATERAAALAATAAITTTPQRILNRSSVVAATVQIITRSQRRLERSGQLHALALVEAFVGAKFGEASFEAIGTITLTRALPPGWIDFPGVGPITQPIGGFGTVYGGGRILTSGHGSLAQPRRGGPPS